MTDKLLLAKLISNIKIIYLLNFGKKKKRNQEEKEAKNHDQSKNLTNTTNLSHSSLLEHSTHNSTMHIFVLNDRDHLSGYIIYIIFWATNSNKNKRTKLVKSNQSTWFYGHNQPRSFMWV